MFINTSELFTEIRKFSKTITKALDYFDLLHIMISKYMKKSVSYFL